MKLVFFQNKDQLKLGSLKPDQKIDCLEATDLLTAIENPSQLKPAGAELNLGDVDLLAPISGMEKVICIGANYADHAREMGGDPPKIPVVFSKFASSIIGPGVDIKLPSISDQVDFEAELVVVIGKGGKDIPRDSALDHVFGYCCGNDISARDWQRGKPGGQWLLGKQPLPCLLYTSPSPRDRTRSRMPSSA